MLQGKYLSVLSELMKRTTYTRPSAVPALPARRVWYAGLPQRPGAEIGLELSELRKARYRGFRAIAAPTEKADVMSFAALRVVPGARNPARRRETRRAASLNDKINELKQNLPDVPKIDLPNVKVPKVDLPENPS